MKGDPNILINISDISKKWVFQIMKVLSTAVKWSIVSYETFQGEFSLKKKKKKKKSLRK